MVRFSAAEADIEQMLRFLVRRMPSGIRLVPLQARHRDDLRWRRTIRPLVHALRATDGPIAWGLRDAPPGDTSRAGMAAIPRLDAVQDPKTGTLTIDPDDSQLITLALGPAEGKSRRREALLLMRDWDVEADVEPDTPLARRADLARSLVDRCSRHLRRNAFQVEGRWLVGDTEPA
ncbi:MAG: hypothetical protein H7Z41_01915 [Cytophagales bacterium]|nr:hypothetical protein [Armatimonadota bacterium]